MPAFRSRNSLLPACLSSHMDSHMVHPCDYSRMHSLTLNPLKKNSINRQADKDHCQSLATVIARASL